MTSHHGVPGGGVGKDGLGRSGLRQQLELAREPGHYDVEAGLRRHRELVAQGAPPPAWAGADPLARHGVRGVRWLKGLGLLVLSTGALWGAQYVLVERAPGPEAAQAAVASQPPPASPPPPGAGVPSSTVTAPADAPPAGVLAPSSDGTAPAAEAALQATAPDEAAPAPFAAPSPRRATREGRRARPLPRAPGAGVSPAMRATASGPGVTPLTSPPRQEHASPRASGSAAPRAVREASARDASAASAAASAESAAGRAASGDTAYAAPSLTGSVAPRNLVIEDERPEVVVEMQELSRAEGQLQKDPAAALKLVRTSMAQHPKGFLVEERRYVEVMATIALGRRDEARLLGREFVRAYPQSPYRRRVESALVGVPAVSAP